MAELRNVNDLELEGMVYVPPVEATAASRFEAEPCADLPGAWNLRLVLDGDEDSMTVFPAEFRALRELLQQIEELVARQKAQEVDAACEAEENE